MTKATRRSSRKRMQSRFRRYIKTSTRGRLSRPFHKSDFLGRLEASGSVIPQDQVQRQAPTSMLQRIKGFFAKATRTRAAARGG